MILAFQLEFIDKDTLDRCGKVARGVDDKLRAVIEFLNQGRMKKSQFSRLLELYKIFLTRQEKLRFGELAVALKFVPPSTVEVTLKKQLEILKKGKKLKIGELFVAAGVITAKQRDLILLKQQRDFSTRLKKVSASQADMKKIKGDAISLFIQSDALKAFIRKNDRELAMPNPEDVHGFMATHGVTYGLAPTEDIFRFLSTATSKDNLFLVAQSTPMVQSKDAFVEYLFDDAFLTSGSQKEDGTIDFKDRGAMPMVNPGDKLAKKHLPVEGVSGINVFGEAIDPFPAGDQEMAVGDGAKVSGDGMTVVAAVKGFPKKDMTGCVSVVQLYHIKGDVGYKTGHVEFDGDVVVSGTVKPGFKVKCHSLNADAIEGAQITCEGNVIVNKGVLESRIFSRGSISAAYVNQSDINCLGDMIVAREILDSRIVLNGCCRVDNGRILSSDVTAREGIRVMNVGSQGARNTVITAGVSKYAEEEMKRVNALAEQNQTEFDLKISDKEAVESLETELATWQKKIKGVRQKLEKMIRNLEAQKPMTPVKETLIATHKKQLDSLIRHTSDNQADTHKLSKLTEDVREELAEISKVNQTVVGEMMVLRKMNNQSETVPRIMISGKVQSGTKLCGCHSQTIIQKTCHHVRAKEIQTTGENNKTTWSITLVPG